MRSLGVAVAVAAMYAAPLRAEPTIELAAGMATPIAGDTWTTDVDTGWKLAGRGTSDVGGLPAIVSIEWGRMPSGPCPRGFDRFRVTAGLTGYWPVGAAFAVSARVAVGLDAVMCGTASMSVPALPQTKDWFDFGLAGEAAATLWLYEGVVDVGVELGLPVSLHWQEGSATVPALDYLGLDLDVLLAVRMR